MIFTEKFQTSVGKVVLRRDLKKLSRKRIIHNLNTAENVGVVFSPANKEELKIIKGFLSFLSNIEIKVFPLALIDSKKNDIEVVLEKNINFIQRKDFNWFHKPFTKVLKDFISEDFDILINLCMEDSLPINYIVSQSKAKLKTGKYFENTETFCDLMIDIKESNNISYLIEQTSHYLSVINNSK